MDEQAQAFMDDAVELASKRRTLRANGANWSPELLDDLDAHARRVAESEYASDEDVRRATRVMRDAQRFREC